ncbi:hypothetical protein MMC24_002810 [Lignoscripta atroalba]|nr:hypothetical protein [Lignoscripta atroalba]
MSSYNSYPPHRLHSSQPISPAQALTLLSSYLEATAVDAYLHPNALLTESGPISATSGSNTGLVLHNLKRVEAGLRGEHLGADLSFAKKFGGEGLPDLHVGYYGVEGAGAGSGAGSGTKQTAAGLGRREDDDAEMGDGEWQDRTEFEREQEVVEGEIGERNQAGVVGSIEGGDVPTVERSKTTGDKVERKQRKRERRAKEKQEKEVKRMKAKMAEK